MPEPFQLPPSDELCAIVKDFGLNREQARELELVIRHAHEDLEGFYRVRMSRPERAMGIAKLKEIHSAITQLLKVLGRNAVAIDSTNESLPFAMRKVIGEVISPYLIAEVTGRTLQDLQYEHARHAAGLEHGGRLLAAQLHLIKEPLDAWLADQILDPGGPEPDHTRNHLIAELAKAAPSIIGRKATATAKGLFERLVAAAFHACGLDDTGLDRRIERVLKACRDGSS